MSVLGPESPILPGAQSTAAPPTSHYPFSTSSALTEDLLTQAELKPISAAEAAQLYRLEITDIWTQVNIEHCHFETLSLANDVCLARGLNYEGH